MARRPARAVTVPPRVVPLLPIAFVGIFVAARTLDVLAGVSFLVRLPVDGTLWHEAAELGGGDAIAAQLALDLALLVAASVLLRWLVRRWVIAQPAEPPRAG